MFGRKLKITAGLRVVLSFAALAQNGWNAAASGGSFPLIAQSNFFAFFFSEPKIDDEQKASANNDDKLAPLATKTWDGGGATNNWSEAANWSGDVVPVAADVAVFDNTSSKNAVIDVDVTVTSVSIFDLYLGTISQVSFVKSDHRQKNRKIIF